MLTTLEFEQLPSEICHYIISFFDSNSIHNFVYVNQFWHKNEDVWKLMCTKKGIQDNEKRSSWKQLFNEQNTYVQVVEAAAWQTEHTENSDDVPVQHICMLGTGGVGLTAIIRQFLFKELFLKYDPTVEDLYFGKVIINGERRNLEILDTAGQEEYSALRDQYIKGYRIFVYVFSVTSVAAFQAIDKIIKQTQRAHDNENIYGILLGNKIDLKDERTVSKEEGEQKAKFWNMPYMETTIYDRHTILNAFATLLKNCEPPQVLQKKQKKKRSRKLKKMKSCNIL
jgi:small GTP-binding protein